MPLPNLLNPRWYLWRIRHRVEQFQVRRHPNLRGATLYRPGHFYSPLLDIESIGAAETAVRFDGEAYWEHVDLRPEAQRTWYESMLKEFPPFTFLRQKSPAHRYFPDNEWFGLADAVTLSGLMRKEKPRRIVEVGSGFSSAAMLDTLDESGASAELTFIEPFPEMRLHSLLRPQDQSRATLLSRIVQEVPLTVFDQLEDRDFLFVDSSHVAKVGSDLVFLLLRVLPRLRPGVFVHFHDIFYPDSYPIQWIRDGRAWNESLFLRAFLAGNPKFELVAFNSFAGHVFPEVFADRLPEFLKNNGGSIWLKKMG